MFLEFITKMHQQNEMYRNSKIIIYKTLILSLRVLELFYTAAGILHMLAIKSR